jgi:poly(hydroxyalkanoate) granule-associated protein
MATKTRRDQDFTLVKLPQDLIERGRGMAGKGHDVWLAGLGAFAAVEEEGLSLFNDLVDRGRTVENSGRRRVVEVREELEEKGQKMTREVEERVYDPFIKAMRSFGVPTRGEIRELSGKVDALSRQVQQLLSRMPGAMEDVEYAVFYVMAREDGWIVGKEGVEDALHVEKTKELAMDRARTLVHNQAPSRLHVYRRDGSIQDTFTYDE